MPITIHIYVISPCILPFSFHFVIHFLEVWRFFCCYFLMWKFVPLVYHSLGKIVLCFILCRLAHFVAKGRLHHCPNMQLPVACQLHPSFMVIWKVVACQRDRTLTIQHAPTINNDASDPATEVSGAGVVLSLLQRRLVELHVGRFGTYTFWSFSLLASLLDLLFLLVSFGRIYLD